MCACLQLVVCVWHTCSVVCVCGVYLLMYLCAYEKPNGKMDLYLDYLLSCLCSITFHASYTVIKSSGIFSRSMLVKVVLAFHQYNCAFFVAFILGTFSKHDLWEPAKFYLFSQLPPPPLPQKCHHWRRKRNSNFPYKESLKKHDPVDKAYSSQVESRCFKLEVLFLNFF